MRHDVLPYNDYGGAMRQRLGGRIQKLALDAAMSCPNRDGTVAHGGCTFCLDAAFSPSYCREAKSITAQIDRALAFHHSRGRHGDIYIAYFQAGTSTNSPIEHLEKVYIEALSHPAISGIIISTRPDCIDSQKLDLLEQLSHRYFVAVEYGIESVYDTTLSRVNRGHNFATAVDAVAATRKRGITTGAHFIIGLPGESRNDIIDSVTNIHTLNLDTIKFHQLQIYRNTPIAKEWAERPEEFLFSSGDTHENYISLIVDILRRLNPHTAVDRIVTTAPRHLLLASPLDGIRPDVVRNEVVKRMINENLRQGDLFIR